jgi:hypothetical protein
MPLELDHVFICCDRGAPEGDALVRLGLREGSPNVHAGQGTANRRFFFENAYLELLFVIDPAEARGPETSRTRLWERWSGRTNNTCPFALVFRPKDQAATPPFATWSYHPKYLPAGHTIEFAEGTSLEEPELIYLPFARLSGPPAHEPTEHALPFRHVRDARITLPLGTRLSAPSQAAQAAGLVSYRFGSEHLLELAFLAADEMPADLRPALPLKLRGVTART